MPVKLDTDIIRVIALFEKITTVHARDCLITDDFMYFLVDNDRVGLAIGRDGSNIKELRRIFGKNIKIFGYSDNQEDQIKNLIPHAKNIESNNGFVIVTIPKQDRTAVIGRNGSNIKIIKEILKRNFDIKDLKIR